MKKLLICFLLISLLLTAGFVFAQKELEIEYPDVPGSPGPTSKSAIPDYAKYIFNFAIWASAFLALGILVYGGLQYLTSTGNVEKIRDAKEQIASALLGLLILFGSYLILTNINPQLVIFRILPVHPTFSTLQQGVLVCKEQADVNIAWNLQSEALDPSTPIGRKREIREQLKPLIEKIYGEQCYHVDGGGDIRKEFDDWNLTNASVYIRYIYFISGENKFYGAIIYEDKGFNGKAEIVVNAHGANGVTEVPINLGEIKISSIRPFAFVQPGPNDKAILYEKTDFNQGTTGPPKKTFPLRPNTCTVGSFFIPESIEIKGNYIVVLYTELEARGKNDVFIEPGDYDLNNSRVACLETCWWHLVPYPCTKSCVKSACAYGGKLY